MKRTAPTLKNKLASALLALGHVPHDHAKEMTDDQVISLYQFDHYPHRHIDGGPTVGWNLVPRLIMEHRAKTGKVDQPAIAKDRRITSKWQAFTAKMARKAGDEPTIVPKPKFKRKISSRGFDKRKRKFAN